MVERRWVLHAAEIVDARELARKLAEKLGPSRTPPGIGSWENASGHDPAYKQAIAVEITAILESIAPSRWLYEDPAFKEAKREPYAKLDEATNHEVDAVFNLNRQMFDSIFDDEVRHSAQTRFDEIVGHIHERARNGAPRTSLSISGGGIRSATFALGVLTGLARNHILEKFDFLSTVSGGGYIGSWLSSWVRRDAWGIRGVAALLAAPPRDSLDPEPPPVSHLRAYSNYLTPRLGLLSADTWSLIATYLRNLLLNWVVIIPLLTGLLAVPRVVFTAIMRDTAVVREVQGMTFYDSSGASVALIVGLLLLVFGLFVLVTFRPISDGPKTRAFTDGKFIGWVLLPLVGSAIALMLAWAWYTSVQTLPLPLWYFIAFTGVSTLAAFVAFLFHFLRTPHVDISRGRKLARIVGELGGGVVAGLLGGTLVWVLANKVFHHPTLVPVELVSAVRWPIFDPGNIDAKAASYVVFGVPLLLVVLFLQAVVFVGGVSHHSHDFDREWWARASGWVCLAALAGSRSRRSRSTDRSASTMCPRILGASAARPASSRCWPPKREIRGGSETERRREHDHHSSPTSHWLGRPGLRALHPLAHLPRYNHGAASVDGARTARASSRYDREGDAPGRAGPPRVRCHGRRPAGEDQGSSAGEQGPRPLPRALWVVEHTDPYLMLLIALGSPLLALLVSRCIGVNVFSMHAMYRNRLVRAYLGASRWRRDPNRFTGFDPRDNLPMHDLRPEYLLGHSFRDIDACIAALATRAQTRGSERHRRRDRGAPG